MTKDQHEQAILKIVEEESIFSVLDIFAFYTKCSRKTFYDLELHKSDTIKNAIDDNKVKTKQTLKKGWLESDNPTLQLALFKSICTDEERKALSMNYTELTGKDGKSLIQTTVVVKNDHEKAIVESVLSKE